MILAVVGDVKADDAYALMERKNWENGRARPKL